MATKVTLTKICAEETELDPTNMRRKKRRHQRGEETFTWAELAKFVAEALSVSAHAPPYLNRQDDVAAARFTQPTTP